MLKIKLAKIQHNNKTFEKMTNSMLFVFFIPSSIVAFYWGLALSKISPKYVSVANEYGIDATGIIIGFIILLIAFKAWYFGCIAKRTGGLIYDRWFK